MRKIYLLFFAFVLGFSAKSQVSHLVISQVYGGGGNTSATYNRDFVEIFNPTAAPVNLANWSIQYQSSGGTTWAVNTITAGTIAPGGYFLVQLAGGATGTNLPTPDASPASPSNLSGTVGKVALVNGTTAVTSCTDAAIVDKVSYGSPTNVCNETANATAPSNNTSSLLRVNNGCTDNDNNSTDFTVGTVNPRNTSSVTNSCAANSVTTGVVAGTPFCIDASTGVSTTVAYNASGTYNTTFTAYLSDATGSFASPLNIGSATVNGTNPTGTINIAIPAGTASGTGYQIRVDASSPAISGTPSASFEIVNGAKNVSNVNAAPGNMQASISWSNPSNCFDDVLIVAKAASSITATPSGDGTAYTASNVYGSGTAFDGGFVVYKGITSPQTITGLTNGTTYYLRIFSRRGSNWSNGVEVMVTPAIQPNPGDIVINQLSPDYNGASNEYVELVNKTNNSYDLSGLALRYQSASGSGSTVGNLTGTILPKRFWLLSPDATVTVGQTNSLPRDGSFTAGFAAGSGQVALVRISDGVIIDAVGYGTITGGTYTETAAASAPPADGGIKRVTDGADTDNNSVDFAVVANADIFLRNSGSAPLPVRFSNIKAIQKGNSIEVAWSNSTEENVVNYSVERSSNSRTFSSIGQLNARVNNGGKADYSFIDVAPFSGDNFYRIKAVETTGKTIYSNIVRMNTIKKGTDLVVYPNPLKGSDLNVQFSNLPAGKYTIKVIAMNGQEIESRLMNHAGGNVSETINLKNLKPGIYGLQVNGEVSLTKTFAAE